jgi:hypothetical protein
MNTKILTCSNEDTPQSILVGARVVGDSDTAYEAEKRVQRDYLLAIRRMLTENDAAQAALTKGDQRRQQLIEACIDIVYPGTEDVYETAVDVILEEHDKLVSTGSKVYIVDQSTGLAVLPLTDQSVFRPTDFIGEDGQIHKSQPILHPGISSALALLNQEKERTRIALIRGGPAYEHIRDPSSIVTIATECLAAHGITVEPCSEGQTIAIEVGREQVDGVFQSPNLACHRHALFGALLARKIAAIGVHRCEIRTPKLCQDSKQRWYTIDVIVSMAAEA